MVGVVVDRLPMVVAVAFGADDVERLAAGVLHLEVIGVFTKGRRDVYLIGRGDHKIHRTHVAGAFVDDIDAALNSFGEIAFVESSDEIEYLLHGLFAHILSV